MAIPAIPQGFTIQQGNAQVFLSWALVPGALSYSVERSTDGVTYAVLGSAASPEYLDTSVAINTTYYYKVASVNLSGTSSYTGAKSIVATLPGKLCLGEIRLRAQQRSDMQSSNFITVPEWNFFINQAAYELYDLLITAYEDYFVAPRLIFNTDGTQFYDLPNGQNYDGAKALYKLYGVDCGLGTESNAWQSLKKFDFIERNRYIYPQITTSLLGVFNLAYRIVGDRLMLIPVPTAGQPIGLWYFPRLTTMLRDTDVMDGFSGWDQYVIVRSAKYALDKEESDTSKLDSELLYLKTRIEESASNRDAGQPDTISSTRNNARGGFGMGIDGSFGGF